jgi:glutamate synthase (NADPH) small chain
MADPRGFLEFSRSPAPERDPHTRTRDHDEIFLTLPGDEVRRQGARCMDCGVPFCHQGCPLGNLIPDWNDLVRRDRWREAIDRLHATNNFPEFTGLICPAPCETACVLAINDDAVTIKQIEWAIIERAFEEGWVSGRPPTERTGRSVGVVGSGPAGLAVAEELNAAGHRVVIYERDEGPGGLIRFGVPDFKFEKWMIDRRVALLEEAGVEVVYEVDVGVDVAADELLERHDAVVLAVGSRIERGLELPGRELDGIETAMTYLYGRNRAVAASQGRRALPVERPITAAGRHVVVIGGGDTAADCVASAHREEPRSVTQIDTYPAPDGVRPRDLAPWPDYPKRMPSTYALDEGGTRRSSFATTRFRGRAGHVCAIEGVATGPPPDFEPRTGSDSSLPADLVLIAIGFTGAEPGLPEALGLERSDRGTIPAEDFATAREGVFACGDARVGQSLIVTAIAEGRTCARAVHRELAAASTGGGAGAAANGTGGPM